MNARLVEAITPQARVDLDEVVDALAAVSTDLSSVGRTTRGALALPSREALEVAVSDLQAALFPAHFGAADLSVHALRRFVRDRLEAALANLQEQVRVCASTRA